MVQVLVRRAFMLTMTAQYLAMPDEPRYLGTVIGASVLAIVAGTLVNRTWQNLAWWLGAAGTATFIGGNHVFTPLVLDGVNDRASRALPALTLSTEGRGNR